VPGPPHLSEDEVMDENITIDPKLGHLLTRLRLIDTLQRANNIVPVLAVREAIASKHLDLDPPTFDSVADVMRQDALADQREKLTCQILEYPDEVLIELPGDDLLLLGNLPEDDDTA
jgi:hypothetical protein